MLTATGAPADRAEVLHRLLVWAASEGRDLPWRRTRDPWAVLVSEIMLQQTRVARVLERYPRFLDRFPTVSACAAVTTGEVIREWLGLGYNRRAVYLHRCAVEVRNRHDGRLPDDLPALLALPGIGPYTARAVLAFAYERDVGVVDTNVGRILARWSDRTLAPAAAQALADTLVPAGAGWSWNQALMDLGATVCTKRTPACERCPVHQQCGWGGVGPDPALGSAGVSVAQAAFAGSDREGRGRLVRALAAGPVDRRELPAVMGWEDDRGRAERVADALVAEGLAAATAGTLRLA